MLTITNKADKIGLYTMLVFYVCGAHALKKPLTKSDSSHLFLT